MMKKIFSIIIIYLLFIPNNLLALDLYSENAILYNLDTKEVLLDKNKDEKISIASMTKIMTALVAIEQIDNIDDTIILTDKVFENLKEQNAYQAGFYVGEKVTYRDLLYALLLPSGADAAQALAIFVSGDIDNFVILMNNKAKDIGLENTNFANPIGLDDENNYSTVSDVAKLLEYALQNDTFYKIFTTKEYTISNGQLTVENSMDSYKKYYNIDTGIILGSKTGYTYDAGFCLASIANKNDTHLLLVTARAPYKDRIPYHIYDAVNTYEYYFNNYEYKNILNKDDVLVKIKVKGIANKKEFEIKSNDDVVQYIPIDANLKYEYQGVEEIDSNYHTGDVLGVYNIYLDDELLYQTEIILNENIVFYNIYIILGIIVILFIVGIFFLKRLVK